MVSKRRLILAGVVACSMLSMVFFLNCSGGGSGGAAPGADAGSPEAGSNIDTSHLYVGSYQEDAQLNPEDPTSGVVYLNIPASGAFSGQMYFTYVGCQSSNIGQVSGQRTGELLTGTWDGTLDLTQQSGAFNGNWVASQSLFAGTYTVNGGKQHVVVPGCIDYYISPNGTFSLSTIGTKAPANLLLSANAQGLRWSPVANTSYIVVSLIDASAALEDSAQAVMVQKIVSASSTSTSWTGVSLDTGKKYISTILFLNASGQRLGHGSLEFTP